MLLWPSMPPTPSSGMPALIAALAWGRLRRELGLFLGRQVLEKLSDYRRSGLSHRLSHTLSHSVSHMTNGSAEPTLVVPPARDGHRRSFSESDKRRIVEEAGQPGVSLSEVARRYAIAARVLFRWKQELCAAPMFVTVQIADASAPSDAMLS